MAATSLSNRTGSQPPFALALLATRRVHPANIGFDMGIGESQTNMKFMRIIERFGKKDENSNSMLQEFKVWLETVRNIATNLFILFVILGLVGIGVWETFRKTILIEPVEIPTELADLGFTSRIVAHRLIDEARNIHREAKTNKQLRGLSPRWEQVDIEVSVGEIDIQALIRYVKKTLGFSDTRIGGEITRNGSSFELRLRSTNPRHSFNEIPPQEMSELHKLFDLGARELVRAVDPYVLAYYLRERDPEASLKLVKISLKDDWTDDDAWAYNLWGLLLATEGKLADSYEKYSKAIGENQDFAAPYNNWGLGLTAEGKYVKAIEKFEIAVGIDDEFAIAYTNWGKALSGQEKFADAIVKLQKAIKVDPNFAVAHRVWGDALVAKREYDEAFEQYRKAIEKDPAYAGAYNNWGRAYTMQGNHDEAIKKFRKAVEINPKLVLAYVNLGRALMELSEFEGAGEQSRKAIHIDPEYGQAYKLLGDVFEAGEECDCAIAMWQKAGEVDLNESICEKPKTEQDWKDCIN